MTKAFQISPRSIARASSAPVEDPAYLKWLRTLPCAVMGCRAGYVEAAHTGNRGLGQKADDRNAIPLCRFHHQTAPNAYHKGRKQFESRYRLDIPAIIKELNGWYEAERKGNAAA